MEDQVLASGMEAVVLRYGLLYGPGPGPMARRESRRCTSMPPHRPRCWHSPRATRSTTSPMTKAPCRSRRRATSSASIRRSGYPSSGCRKRLTEKTRILQPIAPRFVDRLGEADARTGHDLDRSRAREQLEWRCVKCGAVIGSGDFKRLAESARSGADNRSSATPRRRRISGNPVVGSMAQISTALAEPFGSHTKFRHQ